jgi:hypothetical protein
VLLMGRYKLSMDKPDHIQVIYATMDEGILAFISAGGPLNEFDWEELSRGYRCALCGNDVIFTHDEKNEIKVAHLKDKRRSACERYASYEGTWYVYVVRNIKPLTHADIAEGI